MLRRAVFALLGAALIFGIGLLGGFVFTRGGWMGFQSPWNTAVILKQVQTLSQLVTVKYVLEKVVVLDDPRWYGDNRVVLVAHGIVKAGINLEGLHPGDIDISGKKIRITLPHPNITDVYLDDHRTQILERTTGVMRIFDKDLEQNARRQAVDDLRAGARESGILKDADERARAQLSNLLYQLGFAEVEIRTK